MCNSCFAYNVYIMNGSETGLHDVTTRQEMTPRAYGMEVTSDKSNIFVLQLQLQLQLQLDNIYLNTMKNGEKLTEVDNFVGSTLAKGGNQPSTKRHGFNAPLHHQQRPDVSLVGTKSNVSFRIKFKPYEPSVMSVLPYLCETWIRMTGYRRG